MTVSPDARTPSATVHALSGFTPPGAGDATQPFGIASGAAAVELPDTFAPLGSLAAGVLAGLSARRAPARPDAEVVDLAGRVAALARRERVLWDRRSTAEGAVDAELPPRPVTPPDPRHISYNETEVEGWRYTTLIERPGPRYDYRAACAAHDAATADHQRREAEIGARLGLPRWVKLTDRASTAGDRASPGSARRRRRGSRRRPRRLKSAPRARVRFCPAGANNSPSRSRATPCA